MHVIVLSYIIISMFGKFPLLSDFLELGSLFCNYFNDLLKSKSPSLIITVLKSRSCLQPGAISSFVHCLACSCSHRSLVFISAFSRPSSLIVQLGSLGLYSLSMLPVAWFGLQFGLLMGCQICLAFLLCFSGLLLYCHQGVSVPCSVQFELHTLSNKNFILFCFQNLNRGDFPIIEARWRHFRFPV